MGRESNKFSSFALDRCITYCKAVYCDNCNRPITYRRKHESAATIWLAPATNLSHQPGDIVWWHFHLPSVNVQLILNQTGKWLRGFRLTSIFLVTLPWLTTEDGWQEPQQNDPKMHFRNQHRYFVLQVFHMINTFTKRILTVFQSTQPVKNIQEKCNLLTPIQWISGFYRRMHSYAGGISVTVQLRQL